MKKICKQCAKEFKIPKYRGKTAKFCSTQCSIKWRKRNKIKKIKQICENCGKEFERYLSEIKQGKGKFCSNKCRNESFKTQVEQICPQCGKHFKANLSRIKRAKNIFCSCECKGKWDSEYSKDENSPSWKGGVSRLPYCQKFNNDLKERVREFFDRKCYVCDMTEEENKQRLSVHHVNYDKMMCCNSIPPLFVPLCQRHHNMSNYNREDWQEFFEVSLQYLTQGKCFYTQEEMVMGDKAPVIERK